MNNISTMPQNSEAEKFVLGCVLVNQKTMDVINSRLEADDFFLEKNRQIFKAQHALYSEGKDITVTTIVEKMKVQNVEITSDFYEYIYHLVEEVHSIYALETYITIIKEKSVERTLYNTFNDLNQKIVSSSLEHSDLLDKTEDLLENMIKKRQTSDFITAQKAADKVYDVIDSYTRNKSDLTGLDTGYPRLNNVTLGLQNSDLIILAARPSVGKSTFALNLALNVCNKNKEANVAFFSLEMSIEQIMMRLFSYQGRLGLGKIRNGRLNEEELIILGVAKGNVGKYKMHFDESNTSDIYEIRAKCRKLKQNNKLDLVIIDYLQLITAKKGGNRQEEVSMISRQLKILAKELNVPVIALSQLSRGVEGREDKTPLLSDLRESGSIEQDADIVMFLSRRMETKKSSDEDDDKKEEKEKAPMSNGELLVDLSIAKNRQGALRKIDYTFIGDECRFIENKYHGK